MRVDPVFSSLWAVAATASDESLGSFCGWVSNPLETPWKVKEICVKNGKSLTNLQFKAVDHSDGRVSDMSSWIYPHQTVCQELGSIRDVQEGNPIHTQVWNPASSSHTCFAKHQVHYSPKGVTASFTCEGSPMVCTLDDVDNQCETSGTASGDWDLRTLVNGSEFGGRWKNWFENVVTCDTLLFPNNDDELRAYLAYAQSNNYKVRITGGTHSASGLVSESSSHGSNTLVISLGRYHLSDSSWCSEGDFCLDQSKGLARANAGRSWLDLYQEIRPLGWFIPTQTAGYFFSIAGTVLGTVHGGAYGKTFLHGYVQRMRVMLWDGSIQVIEGDEVRNWRASYGLLGVLLAVEVEVIHRDTFEMYTETSSYQQWNEENFWKFVAEDSEADLDLSFFPGSKNFNMTREGVYGEYFLDFLTDLSGEALFRTQGVLWKTPTNPKVTKTEAELRAAYVKSEESTGIIREEGGGKIDILNDILHGAPFTNSRTAADLLMHANFQGQDSYVSTASKTVNDGYWVAGAPNVNIAAYFVPIENSFEAFNYVRSQVRERHVGGNSNCYRFNNPVEYRFVQVTDDSLLQIVPPGNYVVSEVLGFVDAAPAGDSWQRAYAEIECEWTTRLGGIPHLMKLHSFGDDDGDGKIEPMQPCRACTYFTDEQKQKFETIRQHYDPHGLFASGSAFNVLLRSCPKNCPEIAACPAAGTPDCGSQADQGQFV